ncbi:MAG: hypothetical protein CM1200mP41_38560 [Gammaproteobacteria bacterium]|nr:MAG: hypothetical protein CM1200mP41_38560 [Gammaproteobacteria bacterium]
MTRHMFGFFPNPSTLTRFETLHLPQLSDNEKSPLSRPTWIEIDLDAVEHNVHTARKLVAKNVKLYGVCKADAMGCGLTTIGQTFAEAGIDGLAVRTPQM